MHGTVSESRFRGYVREIRGLAAHAVASGGLGVTEVDVAREHLDGRAGRELRSAVALHELRRLGAFFTGDRLASLVVDRAQHSANWRVVVDPSCGCGDLLLAAARRLPVEEDLEGTLLRWGAVLHGTDLVAEFVDVARQRLLLLALLRGAKPPPSGKIDLAAALPGLRVADGRAVIDDLRADLVLLNPPYGRVIAPPDCAFASGLTTEAALWAADLSESLPDGVELVAVLPDVLRSGSRYVNWRARLAERLSIDEVVTAGQFDALTDVDVFVLRATKRPDGRLTWPRQEAVGPRLGEWCSVMVGAVVDKRDAHEGPWVPYVTTRELPNRGDFRAIRRRRFAKRLFKPPFVVVRRTSRPTISSNASARSS